MDASSSSSTKCEIMNKDTPPPPPLPPPPPKGGTTYEVKPTPSSKGRSICEVKLPPRPPPPPPLISRTIYRFIPPPLSTCENNEDGDTDEDSRDEEVAEEESKMNLIKAAMYGNAQIFEESNNSSVEQLCRKTVEGNNILHIAVRYEQEGFMKALLKKKKYMEMNKRLISEKNSHGNTPFHVAAAQVGHEYLIDLLIRYKRKHGRHDEDKKPWRAQNSEGNTPLHVALLSNNYEAAMYLARQDPALARIVNNSQEAPLHLAITHLFHYYSTIMTTDLLEKASCVATWRDAKGLTPLLRAASFIDNPSVLLQVTKKIIDVCPESTLMCDPLGKSFLHLLMQNNKILNLLQNKNLDKQFKTEYENIEDLVCLKEISAIYINHQDEDGNTPLHIAFKCGNVRMAKTLLFKYPSHLNLHITNKDGITASFMEQQLNLGRQLFEPRAMTKEESSWASKGDINSLIERSKNTSFHFHGSQDDEGNNFLHLMMSKNTEHHYNSSIHHCREFIDFAIATLYWFPQQLYQTNELGNTPFHVLVQNKEFCNTLALTDDLKSGDDPNLLVKLLTIFIEAILKCVSTITNTDHKHQLPWAIQNVDGNTPLHEAIIANNKLLVFELLRYDSEPACLVNKHGETPLHLLSQTDFGKEEFTVEEIMKMVNANVEALGLSDKNGLIPILRAIKADNLQMVVTLLSNGQKFSDKDGQKFWHLVLNNPSKKFVNGILQNEAFRNLLQQKDKDGYTPLHLVMKEKCFGFVENILEIWGREEQLPVENEPKSNQWLMDLLKLVDKDGLTLIIRALNADNPNLATRLCQVNPEAAKMGDINGKTIWHLLPTHTSYNSVDVNNLLHIKGVREVLEQKDYNGNTPLHLAMKEKCFFFVQDLFETRGREGESSQDNQWLLDLLKILDNDGVTPIIRALNANKPNLAISLCHLNPEAAKIGDINGKTIWHLLSKPTSYKSENVKDLLNNEALRKVLVQKDRDGNTALHLAIKEKCFGFVQNLLEACENEHEFSEGDHPWQTMDLLITKNNVGEAPEDLLADLSILPDKLEKTLLTDRRMRGIRSSWRIPRTQLQNYMSSMNVIAALQTTITFTAAFTVPGGLNQDIGTPILIGRLSFQVFMISDVIAMCLSMMVLICLLWMVATDMRKSVMLQDFALTLLLLSFVATIMTFMAGVYATIHPVKPWMAITTLVLCSLLMLFLPRRVLTNVLLYFKYPKVRFVKKMIPRPCC